MVRDTLLQNVAGTPFNYDDMVYNREQNKTFFTIKKVKQNKNTLFSKQERVLTPEN